MNDYRKFVVEFNKRYLEYTRIAQLLDKDSTHRTWDSASSIDRKIISTLALEGRGDDLLEKIKEVSGCFSLRKLRTVAESIGIKYTHNKNKDELAKEIDSEVSRQKKADGSTEAIDIRPEGK